ncbi:MAG: histidinol-phosphatase HisJ [Verrucomicrobia bacterium]|nr:histidinol-phosphatase HisJ [Verrucomicrobiota bacterium]
MALPHDYHLHTYLCGHAEGSPIQYAGAASSLGISEIGFTEHAPMEADDFDDWRMRLDQLPVYFEMIAEAKHAFADLTIRIGLEIDFLPGYEDWIRKLARQYDWDYLIGSVHYVSETWAVDNPDQIEQWSMNDVEETWSNYLDRLKSAADTGFFDVIGHIDLPKKFGHRPDTDIAALYDEVFDAVNKNGAAIEVNTAGLRKKCKEAYPGLELLRAAYKKGVPIVFGSDAHSPSEVGYGFAGAVDMAKDAGYDTYCTLEKREKKIALI